MADAPKKVSKSLNPKFDFSHWRTMDDIEKFNDLSASGGLAGQRKALATIVKGWDAELDPRDPDSYRKLTPGQWKKINEEANEATKSFLEDAD